MARKRVNKKSKYVYKLSPQKKTEYEELIVLDAMTNQGKIVSLFPKNDEICIKDVMTRLYNKSIVDLDRSGNYFPVQKGKDALLKLNERYQQYNTVYYPYKYVDQTVGDFALAHYYDDEYSDTNDPEKRLWEAFLAKDRFEDFRIAIAEFQKLDVVEIVFLSFLLEGRFRTQENGWEFKFLTGEIWDEMIRVCNNNIHLDHLENDYGDSSEGIATTIVKVGTDVMFQNLKTQLQKQAEWEAYQAQVAAAEATEEQQEEVVEETTTVETVEYVEYVVEDPLVYYSPYWDYGYVWPGWYVSYW